MDLRFWPNERDAEAGEIAKLCLEEYEAKYLYDFIGQVFLRVATSDMRLSAGAASSMASLLTEMFVGQSADGDYIIAKPVDELKNLFRGIQNADDYPEPAPLTRPVAITAGYIIDQIEMHQTADFPDQLTDEFVARNS